MSNLIFNRAIIVAKLRLAYIEDLKLEWFNVVNWGREVQTVKE